MMQLCHQASSATLRLRLSAPVTLAGLGNCVCDAAEFDGAVVGEACMLTGRTASRGLAAVIVLLA
jgi:hypothetical protein